MLERQRTPINSNALQRPVLAAPEDAAPYPHLGRSADFQSAVSQNCILPAVGYRAACSCSRCPADCKSAIQQIENLRYSRFAKVGLPKNEKSEKKGLTRRTGQVLVEHNAIKNR